MTARLLALDPEPDDPDEGDDGPWCRTPSRDDCRQEEIRDLRNKHFGPAALRFADDVPPGRYL